MRISDWSSDVCSSDLPDTKDAIELSYAENRKLPMSAADECMAFKNMIEKEDKTAAQVAARFGKTERFVLGRVRLADLQVTAFDALRKGELTLEIAKAYGSTSATARQARVLEPYRDHYFRTHPYTLRPDLPARSQRGAATNSCLHAPQPCFY